MRKSVEFGFISALSVLTVLSTATVIHDSNAGQHNAVDNLLLRGWNAAVGWVTHRESKTASPAMKDISAQGNHNTDSTHQASGADVPVTVPAGGAGSGWSQADLLRLQDITQRLVTSVTPDEWKTMAKDLTITSTSQAGRDLPTVLRSHLSQSDQNWLLARFTGPQAFGQDDIQLLQQTFSSLQQELTPDEQALLKQQLLPLMADSTAGAK